MMTFLDLRDLAPTGMAAGCVASVSVSVNATLPSEEFVCSFGRAAIKSDLRVGITVGGAPR